MGDTVNDGAVVRYLTGELEEATDSRRRQALEKFAIAAVSGVPWIGGFVAAAQSFREDSSSRRTDRLQLIWLRQHEDRLNALGAVVDDVLVRVSEFGDEMLDRLESTEYLQIVRDAFRAWDEAATDEKRQQIKHLVTNAAGTRLVSDDVLRLFLQLLERYHESHVQMIGELYQNPGLTRYELWTRIYGDELPREDSAEADLYRTLIRDLSTGGVMRQAREVTGDGRFMKRTPKRRPKGVPAPTTLESSFEDTKPYVLTSFGSQFVHYVMTDLAPRIESAGSGQP